MWFKILPPLLLFFNTSVLYAMPDSAAGVKRIVVEVATQKLYLYAGNTLIKTYPVSTAKNGTGSAAGSNKTPLGKHSVARKIGGDAPLYTIFKGRRNTGQLAELNAPDVGDLVTTRILWLRGEEPDVNQGPGVDSFERYIYIHGTAEENRIGTPASHGCVRMLNRDVVELYDLVSEGIEVEIVESLPAE